MLQTNAKYLIRFAAHCAVLTAYWEPNNNICQFRTPTPVGDVKRCISLFVIVTSEKCIVPRTSSIDFNVQVWSTPVA